jgi:hypothetical protein
MAAAVYPVLRQAMASADARLGRARAQALIGAKANQGVPF